MFFVGAGVSNNGMLSEVSQKARLCLDMLSASKPHTDVCHAEIRLQ